jgi:hypothetical protein
MTVTVLMLPGTGFPAGGDGICEEFGRHLDPARFAWRIVDYPAAYGGIGLDESYADSRAAGRQALIDAIKAAPGRVVIAGYSQGAQIVGDLAGIGVGKVLAAALIADPARPPGAGIPGQPAVSGYGITGARPVRGVPAYWAANPGDPITALPADDPLRGIADITGYFSLRSTADAERWAQDLINRAIAGRWQRWWSIGDIRRWGEAIAYARGYLLDGRHTGDYIVRGLAAGLAETINSEVAG